jgi:leucyl/phenylalanyl-tRNA---protein transferase
MSIDAPSRYFPPAEGAPRHGLLRVGGRLEPDWLLDAYAHGVFPWPIEGMLAWFSPDPRGILEFDEFHAPRRLLRTLRSGQFEVSRDRDFAAVVRGCAEAQDRGQSVWLTPSMRTAYARLHALGHAHSVEVWRDGELAGGVYGVALRGLFAAESMFYRVTDASKIALHHLVGHLRDRGFRLFDIQQVTPHTQRLGAREIPRREFLTRLRAALAAEAVF